MFVATRFMFCIAARSKFLEGQCLNPCIVGCSHGTIFLMSPTVLRNFMNNGEACPEVEFPIKVELVTRKTKLPRRSNPKGKDRGKVVEGKTLRGLQLRVSTGW